MKMSDHFIEHQNGKELELQLEHKKHPKHEKIVDQPAKKLLEGVCTCKLISYTLLSKVS